MTGKRTIHIAPNLELDAEELVEAKIGVLGQSGRGKTGFVRKALEECHRVGVPFVAFDPASILWGLKSSYDGKGPGLPILVIGGEHGDVPLRKDAGAEVARAVVRANVSCVIDVGAESKATYRTFVRDFAETIYALNDTGRLLVLDEAPELVPQRLRPDQTQTYDAVERLVRQGRNRGLGIMLVSQRAATVAKDVLTQCASLVVFGLVGAPDRKAIKEWVEAFGTEEQLKEFWDGLASLGKRECWFWSPDEFKAFKRIRVDDFHTFHPDKTHLRRMGWLNVKPVTVDVSATVAQLGETLSKIREEKADAAQVPGLRRQLATLQAKLDAAGKGATAPADRKELDRLGRDLERAKKAIDCGQDPCAVPGACAKHLRVEYEGERKATAPLRRWGASWSRFLAEHPYPSDGPATTRPLPLRVKPADLAIPPAALPAVRAAVRAAERPALPSSGPENGEGEPQGPRTLYSGEKRMLTELVRALPGGLTAAQIGTLAGFSVKSSTFRTYVGYLKTAGYARLSGETFYATDSGQEVLGEIPPAPTTHEELMALWLPKLYSGEAKILRALVESYPSPMSAEETAQRTEFSTSSSTWRTYVGHLRTLGLIDRSGDELSASKHLFP